MGRTKFTKEILSQIDRATNPERKLGKVKIGAPKVLRFTEQEEIDNPQGVSFIFKKRYYSFDRGNLHTLDKIDFTSFAGKMFDGEISTNLGNFIDDGFVANTNLQYSVQIFSDKAREVKLEITSPVCSIAVFNNYAEQFSSGGSFFSNAIITVSLRSGWNLLDIFYYRQRTGGYLKLEGDIGKHISAWRPVDFEPPTKPQWHSNAVVSEYIDPNDFGQFHNVLRWKKYPSDVITGNLERVALWEIYKSTPVSLVDTAGNNVVVVSGWGTDAFAIGGDYRNTLPIEGTVSSPTTSDNYTISGTVYPAGTPAENYTIVTVSGTLSPALNASDPIYIDNFKHIRDIGNHPQLPLVVSGLDKDILNGETYNYYIKAVDNSPNRNKSDRSDIQTIVAGDTDAPSAPTDLDVMRSYRDVTVRWTAPSDSDLAGFVIFVDGVEFDRIYGKINTTYIIGGDADGINLDPAVEYTFGVKAFDYVGNLSSIVTTATKTGAIEGGQTDYDDDDNDGFWIGYDDSNSEYRMSMKSGEQKLTLTSSGLNVVSGTITAGIVQTAVSGQRVVISGSDNTLRFFDPNGINVITLDDNITASLPGIQINDGVIFNTRDANNFVGIQAGYLYIDSDRTDIDAALKITRDGLPADVTPAIKGSYATLSASTTNYNRIGVQGTGSILNGSNSDNIIGLHGNATTAGTGFAYAGYFDSGDVYIKNILHVDSNSIFEDASFKDVVISGSGGLVRPLTVLGDSVIASGTGQVVSKVSSSNHNAILFIDTDSTSEANFSGIQFGHRRVAGSYSVSSIRMRELDLHFELDEGLYIKTNGLERMRIEGSGAIVTSGTVTHNADVTVATTAELKGTKGYLSFGSNVAIDTNDEYLKTVDGITTSATVGYRMLRSGSITGVSVQTNVTTKASDGDVTIEVRKNGANVFSTAMTITATGAQGSQSTQARDLDTFSAGDIISAYINWDNFSDCILDDTIVLVEFYDNG